MRVTVIGAGRLGRSLGALLQAAGVPVSVCGRGEALVPADVYWLAVRDGEIGSVVLPPGSLALHSSGALGAGAIAGEGERGVLHPLMTFPGPEHGLPPLPVPARVEGSPRAVAAAVGLAGALGWTPFAFEGDRRRYHAAASMVSGLSGAWFLAAAREMASASGESEDACRARLLPLALESLRRAASAGPSALTGPAPRGDHATIEAHVAAIDSDLRAAYRALTTLARRGGGDHDFE